MKENGLEESQALPDEDLFSDTPRVERVYVKDRFENKWRRGLLDHYGFVFVPGSGGWYHHSVSDLTLGMLRKLPGVVPYDGFLKDSVWWSGEDRLWNWLYMFWEPRRP